jgi:hypothetical protein
VCGLVLLELFKLIQNKPTEAYMNRAIGLAVNSYTSFTAEEPIKFSTYTERMIPSSDELPPDAYDEKGMVYNIVTDIDNCFAIVPEFLIREKCRLINCLLT